MRAQSLQSCPTLCDPLDYSPAVSVHGILQARILEWVAMPSSRGSSRSRIEPVSPASPTLQADSLLDREALCIQQEVFIKLLTCARSEEVK